MDLQTGERAIAAPERGAPVFRRILLKLSGESLMGDREYGMDRETIGAVAEEIVDVQTSGVETAIVVGGRLLPLARMPFTMAVGLLRLPTRHFLVGATPGASSLNRQTRRSLSPSPSQSATVRVRTCRAKTPLFQYMLSGPVEKRLFSATILSEPGK